MKTIINKILFILLLLPQIVVASDFKISASHSYGSKGGEITKDEKSLSINFDNDNLWIAESVHQDFALGIGSPENFLGGGPKYKITDNLKVSFGILWKHAETEDSYLGSIRLKYKIWDGKIVGFYQPFLDKDAYIAKGDILIPLFDKRFNWKYGFEYRSDGVIVSIVNGLEYNY